jgi:hypothetical protein
MIRPITVLTFILACGSGMYLYQAKHRVHVIDQQIDQTVKQTEALREQSRALHAEWMLLNDPDRLHRLAAQYLTNLQPVAPTQFTDAADLDGRLPPVGPPPPAATGPVVASAATAASTPDQTAKEASPDDRAAADAPGQKRGDGADRVNVAVLPNTPTAPAAAYGNVASEPVIAQEPRADHTPRTVIAQAPSADHTSRPVLAQARTADRALRPVIGEAPRPAAREADLSPVRPHPLVAAAGTPQHVTVWKPGTRHPMIAEAAPPRFIRSEPRPMPVMRPQTAPQSAYGGSVYGGSMLGMARGTSNLPRPVPLNAAYNNPGG